MISDDRTYYEDIKSEKDLQEGKNSIIKTVEFYWWTEDCGRPREAVIKIMDLNAQSVKEADFLKESNKFEENTVKYYYSYEEDNKFYIIMEYCKLGSLSSLIDRMSNEDKTWKEAELLDIFIHLSKIVKNLHSHKLFHRDIKPDNIFITGSSVYKIGD